MAVYNIKTDTGYDIPQATWNTGNSRDNLVIKPTFGVGDYTLCDIQVSLTGNIISLRSCRLETEAPNGAQPSPDIMINNIIVERYP